MSRDLRHRFAGRCALVTGAGSGIGAELARQLAALGAQVVVTDVDPAATERTAATIRRANPSAPVQTAQLDVSDREAVERVVAESWRRNGAVDLLFNNAGIGLAGPTHELSPAHWDRLIDVNLRGVVHGVLAAYPRMVARGRGHIVNTASVAGLIPTPLVVPYAATKHAVVGLTTSLRLEASRRGVSLSVICPGPVDTAILDRPPPDGLPATASAPITARMLLDRLHQRPVPVDRFVHQALAGVARDQAVITAPWAATATWWLHRASPALFARLLRRVTASMERQVVHPGG